MNLNKNEYKTIHKTTKLTYYRNHIQMKIKKYKLISLLIFTIIFTFIAYKILSSPQFNSLYILRSYINDNQIKIKSMRFQNRTKVILLWTDFFQDITWMTEEMNEKNNYAVDETYFQKYNCSQTNCIITSNRNYLSSVELYDTLLFHTAEPFGLNEYFPSIRNHEQFYIFATMESPAHIKHDISDENDIFNLTMSYRLDSDILWPYGMIEDIQTGKTIAPSINPAWRKPTFEHLMNDNNDTKELMNLIKMKNKFAAWFVSHCGSISRRDEIVKTLNEYIEIDIYGECGDLNCPRNSPECYERFDTDYKFYLSFENSLCRDYVTEKFYNALEHYIIPVVYGGADYTRFAPSNSYINVEDFQTIQELAKYLKFLSENPLEYIKYFWWKKYYRLNTSVTSFSFCKLCELLNDESRREKYQYYGNIKNWWFTNGCKLTPNIILT